MFAVCPCWPSARSEYEPICGHSDDAHNGPDEELRAAAADDVLGGRGGALNTGGRTQEVRRATKKAPHKAPEESREHTDGAADETRGLLVEQRVPGRCEACGQVTLLEQHGVCLNIQCSLASKQQLASSTAQDVDQTSSELDKIVAQSCAQIEASRSAAMSATEPTDNHQREKVCSGSPAVSDPREELSRMSLWDILAWARKSGIDMNKVDTAMEESKPKAAVISLLEAHARAPSPVLDPGARCVAAAKKGDTKGIREAIAIGADLRQVGEEGLTALMYTAAKGRLTGLRLLIDAIRQRNPNNVEADLNVRCADTALGGGMFAGATALLLAARWGNTPEVVELVRAGASVDTVAETDATARNTSERREAASPIHVAASCGHAAVVAVLLQAGADSTQLYYDMTARQWARHRGHSVVERVFALHSGGSV